MKKRELIGVLIKSINGFTFGVAMLIIAYISVYFIAGQNIFENEINQLKEINTLLTQFIILGSSYYIFFVEFELLSKVENDVLKVICMIGLYISAMLFVIINTSNHIISDNISVMNIIIIVIVWCLKGLIAMIKSTINEHLINKKIKEKNNL